MLKQRSLTSTTTVCYDAEDLMKRVQTSTVPTSDEVATAIVWMVWARVSDQTPSPEVNLHAKLRLEPQRHFFGISGRKGEGLACVAGRVGVARTPSQSDQLGGTYSYDDADRMTSYSTFRVNDESITTDPSTWTDGDSIYGVKFI